MIALTAVAASSAVTHATDTSLILAHSVRGGLGRQMVHYCIVCEVYISELWWVSIYGKDIPQLPLCTENKMGLAPRRMLRFDDGHPRAQSPAQKKFLG